MTSSFRDSGSGGGEGVGKARKEDISIYTVFPPGLKRRGGD